MSLIINEFNLKNDEIDEFNSKVRCFLIDEDNNILVANYGKVYLLPGGSIEENENIKTAIVRELKEETGVNYNIDELDFLNSLVYYQKDYPKRDGQTKNKLIITHYFVGTFKGLGKKHLTEKEKRDHFYLQLIPIDNLEEIVLNNKNDNPRNVFFVKELLTIFEYFKNNYNKSRNKTKTLV